MFLIIYLSIKRALRDEISKEADNDYRLVLNKWKKIKNRDFNLMYAKEITRNEPVFREMRKSMARMSRDELRELSDKIKPVIVTSRTTSISMLPERKSRSSIKLSISYSEKEKLKVKFAFTKLFRKNYYNL